MKIEDKWFIVGIIVGIGLGMSIGGMIARLV